MFQFAYSTPGEKTGPSAVFLNMSFDHLFGLHGFPLDYIQAAQCAQEGHEKGDLNCTYLLARYYATGTGVPRDNGKVLELAQQMLDKGFAPGFQCLAAAYATGHGVPLDLNKRNDYVSQLEYALQSPVPGVDEEIRYLAFLSAQSLFTHVDYKKMEWFARENFSQSRLPCRHYFLSRALLGQVETNPSIKSALRQQLDEGCRENDLYSFWLKGMVMQLEHLGIYEPDDAQAFQLLLAATPTCRPEIFMHLALSADEQQEAESLLEKFWDACNNGYSRIPRSNGLPCSIIVHTNPFSCGWRVCERGVAQGMLSEQDLGNLVWVFSPIILLKNSGSSPLFNLSVRICCKDKALDRTISLPETLLPGETAQVDPDDYQLDLGENLYVEVWGGDRYASMELNNLDGLDLFRKRNPIPPILMCWDRGFFGGHILFMATAAETLTHVKVRKGPHFSSVFHVGSLEKGKETVQVGKTLIPDGANLEEGEVFIVTMYDYAPVLARVVTTNVDGGLEGWKEGLMKAGVGFLFDLISS